MNKLIRFQEFIDSRGILNVLEFENEFDFLIRRVYYMYGVTDGESRGFHGHRNLKQLIVCINGTVDLLIDDGKKSTTISLKNRNEGVLIDYPAWRELHNFTEETILLVFASEVYDQDDYITDYEEFLSYVKK